MANEILDKWGTLTTITIGLAATPLANTDGRQSSQITLSSPNASLLWIIAKVRTGSTPTAGGLIEFYWSRADDDGTELATGGTGTSDADWTPGADGEKTEVEFIKSITVTATGSQDYVTDFFIEHPGTDGRLIIVNESGDALDSTAGNHEVQYRELKTEVQ